MGGNYKLWDLPAISWDIRRIKIYIVFGYGDLFRTISEMFSTKSYVNYICWASSHRSKSFSLIRMVCFSVSVLGNMTHVAYTHTHTHAEKQTKKQPNTFDEIQKISRDNISSISEKKNEGKCFHQFLFFPFVHVVISYSNTQCIIFLWADLNNKSKQYCFEAAVVVYQLPLSWPFVSCVFVWFLFTAAMARMNYIIQSVAFMHIRKIRIMYFCMNGQDAPNGRKFPMTK